MAIERKRLAEIARGLHRSSERMWARVSDPAKYDMAPADVDNLQRLATEISRSLTKLKLKKSAKK